MATATCNTLQFLRLPQVKELTALSRSTIYAEIKSDRFPKQVRLTAKSVGWLLSDIQDYLATKVAQSRNLTKEGV